jgi:broad specificity phosphatase PhoE
MYNYLFRWMLQRNHGGEIYEETMARFDRCFREIVDSNPPDSRVAVVSHGYVITLNAIRAVRQRPRDIVRVGNPLVANGSVTKFIIDKDLDIRLEYFARKEHLR